MDEEVAPYKQLAFAVATKKSYASQLKLYYLSFCNNVNCCPVPVVQANLLCYTAVLTRRLAPHSIPAFLNIFRVLHLEINIPNPLCANFVLDTLLKGINRDKIIQVKQSLAITPEITVKNQEFVRSVGIIVGHILDRSCYYFLCLSQEK